MTEQNIRDMLSRLGVTELSDMQSQACQTLMRERNVVLLAPTGTGKTLAFLLPLLQSLDAGNPDVQALILSPTRELAAQTASVLTRMKPALRSVCLHGGRAAMDEHRTMRSTEPQIVVGTPGRVIDHMDKGNMAATTVRWLVIDEFDKMLELKFQPELGEIFSRLPNIERLTLVSATMADEIPQFIGFGGKTPVYLDYLAAKNSRQPSISHYTVASPQKDKLDTLRRLLCKCNGEQAVVFLGFREAVERVGGYLKEQGFACTLFHGGLPQEDRERALYVFAGGAANVLVSTDLSARGLDIPSLRHVIHYHLPQKREDYLHRCGRTGRWDADGNSYLIVGPEEQVPGYDGIDFSDYALEPPYPAPVAPAYRTIYIGKGKKDKLSKGDILGFLCKQGGARAEDIGRIDVRDHFTYVSVSAARARQILRQCQGERIKKVKTRIELASF